MSLNDISKYILKEESCQPLTPLTPLGFRNKSDNEEVNWSKRRPSD